MKPNIPKEEKPTHVDKTDEEIMSYLAIHQETHQHEQNQQKEQNQHDKEKLLIEIGYIGRVFGDSKHTAPNIVAITLVACFILMIVILIMKAYSIGNATDLNTILLFLTSIISLAFGYIFGSSSK